MLNKVDLSSRPARSTTSPASSRMYNANLATRIGNAQSVTTSPMTVTAVISRSPPTVGQQRVDEIRLVDDTDSEHGRFGRQQHRCEQVPTVGLENDPLALSAQEV